MKRVRLGSVLNCPVVLQTTCKKIDLLCNTRESRFIKFSKVTRPIMTLGSYVVSSYVALHDRALVIMRD